MKFRNREFEHVFHSITQIEKYFSQSTSIPSRWQKKTSSIKPPIRSTVHYFKRLSVTLQANCEKSQAPNTAHLSNVLICPPSQDFAALPSVSKVSIRDFVFCFSNTRILEHFVLVLCVVISAVSRQHLHTEYLSPFFLDPILLMRNKMVTRT